MAEQYVARDKQTGFEVAVTGDFPEHPDDRMRIARTTTLFTKLMSTLLQRDESQRRVGFRAIETQLELADALIRQDHAEVQRLVRETLTSMGVSEDQLRELAERLAEAGGLDPRVAQELSRAFGLESDALDIDVDAVDAVDAQAETRADTESETDKLDPQIMQQLEELLADAERANPEAASDERPDQQEQDQPEDPDADLESKGT